MRGHFVVWIEAKERFHDLKIPDVSEVRSVCRHRNISLLKCIRKESRQKREGKAGILGYVVVLETADVSHDLTAPVVSKAKRFCRNEDAYSLDSCEKKGGKVRRAGIQGYFVVLETAENTISRLDRFRRV